MRKNRGKASPTPNAFTRQLAVLSSFSGVPLKVSSLHSGYLFTARIQGIAGNMVLFSLLYEAPDIDLRPWEGPLFEAELRGYNKLKRKAIRVQGLIQFVSGGTWRLTQVTFLDTTERMDYRQEICFDGTVTFPDRRGITGFCQVLDLSMGGVCLVMNRPTAEGERLRLQAAVLEEAGIDSLPCLVRYNQFDSEDNLLCGCRFENLDTQTRERLAHLMAKLQTQSRRGPRIGR